MQTFAAGPARFCGSFLRFCLKHPSPQGRRTPKLAIPRQCPCWSRLLRLHWTARWRSSREDPPSSASGPDLRDALDFGDRVIAVVANGLKPAGIAAAVGSQPWKRPALPLSTAAFRYLVRKQDPYGHSELTRSRKDSTERMCSPACPHRAWKSIPPTFEVERFTSSRSLAAKRCSRGRFYGQCARSRDAPADAYAYCWNVNRFPGATVWSIGSGDESSPNARANSRRFIIAHKATSERHAAMCSCSSALWPWMRAAPAVYRGRSNRREAYSNTVFAFSSGLLPKCTLQTRDRRKSRRQFQKRDRPMRDCFTNSQGLACKMNSSP